MKSVFIGIDYIYDITHKNGKIARSYEQCEVRDIINKTNFMMKVCKENNIPIILVKVGFNKNYFDQPKSSKIFGTAHIIRSLELESQGTKFHPELNYNMADLIITKPRISAFYGTNLDATLRANKVQKLLISGVSTSWAVQSTVRDAHDRDYEVLVIEDACAAQKLQEHDESIHLLSRISEIITTRFFDGNLR